MKRFGFLVFFWALHRRSQTGELVAYGPICINSFVYMFNASGALGKYDD